VVTKAVLGFAQLDSYLEVVLTADRFYGHESPVVETRVDPSPQLNWISPEGPSHSSQPRQEAPDGA
jgi:hypothetical protein